MLTVENIPAEGAPGNICIITCDTSTCGNVFRRETAIWKDAQKDAKALGWKTQYYRGRFMHFCPGCSADS